MKPHPTKSKPRKAKPSPRHKGVEEVSGKWLVLDLSPEARERRVEQVAKALLAISNEPKDWGSADTEEQETLLKMSRAVLAVLGDTPAGEGRGK